jgi:hypothetical protein
MFVSVEYLLFRVNEYIYCTSIILSPQLLLIEYSGGSTILRSMVGYYSANINKNNNGLN